MDTVSLFSFHHSTTMLPCPLLQLIWSRCQSGSLLLPSTSMFCTITTRVLYDFPSPLKRRVMGKIASLGSEMSLVFTPLPSYHVAKFLVPHVGDIVNSGKGLSYLPARLHRLAGQYDSLMPESTIFPFYQELRIWALAYFCMKIVTDLGLTVKAVSETTNR
jgi:hypothetical protein